MKGHHGWEPQERWLVKTPGVVFALAMAVRAYTEPGDAVLIQQPVYYPFSEVIRDNGRKVVSSDLYLGRDQRYHIGRIHFLPEFPPQLLIRNKNIRKHHPCQRKVVSSDLYLGRDQRYHIDFDDLEKKKASSLPD